MIISPNATNLIRAAQRHDPGRGQPEKYASRGGRTSNRARSSDPKIIPDRFCTPSYGCLALGSAAAVDPGQAAPHRDRGHAPAAARTPARALPPRPPHSPCSTRTTHTARAPARRSRPRPGRARQALQPAPGRCSPAARVPPADRPTHPAAPEPRTHREHRPAGANPGQAAPHQDRRPCPRPLLTLQREHLPPRPPHSPCSTRVRTHREHQPAGANPVQPRPPGPAPMPPAAARTPARASAPPRPPRLLQHPTRPEPACQVQRHLGPQLARARR